VTQKCCDSDSSSASFDHIGYPQQIAENPIFVAKPEELKANAATFTVPKLNVNRSLEVNEFWDKRYKAYKLLFCNT